MDEAILIEQKRGGRVRRPTGSVPKRNAGWREIGRVEAGGEGWLVFENPKRASGKWRSLKIVAEGRAPNKANYWLGWSLHERRFAEGKDLHSMRQHRPDLHQVVFDFLDEWTVTQEPAA